MTFPVTQVDWKSPDLAVVKDQRCPIDVLPKKGFVIREIKTKKPPVIGIAGVLGA
jgi:hypothetical protein